VNTFSKPPKGEDDDPYTKSEREAKERRERERDEARKGKDALKNGGK
jgi:hypothetical protein